MGFVSRPRFEDYREKYAPYFKLERRNGILQAQMHTTGGPSCTASPFTTPGPSSGSTSATIPTTRC